MSTQPATNQARRTPPVNSHTLRVIRADAVRTRRIPWLWRGKLPLGEITNFNGLPGEGKSLMTCAVTAAVTTGRAFPDGTENTLPPSEVLILSTEDRAESVLVPRLKAAGADLSKVIILKSAIVSSQNNQLERSVALDTDAEQIKSAIESNPGIRYFVIDPVTNHLGKKRMHKEQEVRDVLNQLCLDNVATNIVCHLNKNANLAAQQRSMGAAGFTGRARAAFILARDPNDKNVHHMLSTKANYSKEDGFRFRIETKPLKLDDGSTENVPYIVYVGESDADADGLLDVKAKRPTKTKIAQDFLQQFLADGAKPQAECSRRAADLNISERTLETAKKNLGVESKKSEGKDGQWLWSLSSALDFLGGD